MILDWLRPYCLSFPGVTESVQWGNNLVFKVAAKIFAIAELEPGGPHVMAFKCSPEDFAELTERQGITPAPYLARAQWVAIESEDVLGRQELQELVKKSYDLVVAKLPKKAREGLSATDPRSKAARSRSSARKR